MGNNDVRQHKLQIILSRIVKFPIDGVAVQQTSYRQWLFTTFSNPKTLQSVEYSKSSLTPGTCQRMHPFRCVKVVGCLPRRRSGPDL
ncbi:hypothetical protein TNCT_469441 [Trichonephila clavata]|uniref:Uncharacterized protein n=1 Tax=Trichonephila clavata TaxID=2740835 RepID=A0A8X6JR95_TRICU|nr:hypothetical protein TNCT_469441 [Trichonephila clavata]